MAAKGPGAGDTDTERAQREPGAGERPPGRPGRPASPPGRAASRPGTERGVAGAGAPGAGLPPGEPEPPESEELRASLLSLERLDRASPDLWPEQIPGVSEFAPLQPAQSPPAWGRGLAPEDINYMHQLGSLTTSGLIIEVKKLHDLAYQLGLEEAKEMTRGKYLNIFTSRRPR